MNLSFETLETPALTKAQLAELLFQQIGLNKRESKDMIDAFFDLVAKQLIEGEDVKISGFGNFQIRTKAPRPGRNPRTGETIPIKARRVLDAILERVRLFPSKHVASLPFTPAKNSKSKFKAYLARLCNKKTFGAIFLHA